MTTCGISKGEHTAAGGGGGGNNIYQSHNFRLLDVREDLSYTPNILRSCVPNIWMTMVYNVLSLNQLGLLFAAGGSFCINYFIYPSLIHSTDPEKDNSASQSSSLVAKMPPQLTANELFYIHFNLYNRL